MFVGPDLFLSSDVPSIVIIGSGPAGLSLGASLAERQIPCLILEAGDREYETDIQDDYIGDITGDAYIALDVTRLRMFGGSSNHWGGWCRHLDAWDFEAVPGLSIPAWPIRKSDLDPYSARTNEILEVPDPVDQPVNDHVFEAQLVHSPPVRFSEKYGPLVRTSDYLNVALRTSVTALHAQDGRIVGLDLVDANGNNHTISPEITVLACGGIENSRLLLWSNVVSSQRVVAQPGALGRYWMEHPHEFVGHVHLSQDIHQNPLQKNSFALSVKPDRLLQFGALNAAVRLRYPQDRSFKDRVQKGLCNVHPKLLDVANLVSGKNSNCGEKVLAVWEQAPDFENRIALSETSRDSFGSPSSHLFWRKTEQDYLTARVIFETVAAHIVKSGAGMVRADPHLISMGGYPETGLIGGNHHMGGTRMSGSPAEGIVNSDLRIHGVSNGYIAGSSVFVRAGHANPTYTIVQLSLRLADHLAARLRG